MQEEISMIKTSDDKVKMETGDEKDTKSQYPNELEDLKQKKKEEFIKNYPLIYKERIHDIKEIVLKEEELLSYDWDFSKYQNDSEPHNFVS